MSESTEVSRIPMDPHALVRHIVERDPTPEVLHQALDLLERIESRNARAAFFDALSAFQDAVPEIRKTGSANIKTRSGGQYGYTFAPLEEIARTIRQPLKAHGLSYSWTTEGAEGGILNVVCILRHVDGHEERSAFPVPTQTDAAMSGAQKYGAALTYGRRQSLVAVLGLTVADEDNDAAMPEASASAMKSINEGQIADLEALIQEHKVHRPRLLGFLGVESIEDLTMGGYKSALKAIEEHRKRQAGA
jgi:hypothetical protein